MKKQITREIDISKYVQPGKVLIIYGPRQVGKTTSIKNYLKNYIGRYREYTGDSITTQEIFSSQRLEKLSEIVEGLDLLFIDEAQNVKNIGLNLKIIIDQFPKLSVVVTGSSSFELAGQIGEPLMGRNIFINMYPITFRELKKSEYYEPTIQLDHLLRFGSYPEVLIQNGVEAKIAKVQNLSESFLLKDILRFENLKKPDLLINLLKLLAFQIGSETNINKLAKELQVNNKTVERYINILEQSFVVFRLKSFSNNMRNEIKKKSKIYFYDLGIRNSIINDFTATNIGDSSVSRKDLGSLFENFLVVERLKNNSYMRKNVQTYFWRNVYGKEVDYVESSDAGVYAFEFTISNKKNKKYPKIFEENLKKKISEFKIVTSENFQEFV